MASFFPCTDDPNEIIDEIVQAKTDAEKFSRFVNGSSLEEVQLGDGEPTPTLRNLSHLVKSAAATLDGSDVSGKVSDAANGGTTLRMLADRFGDVVNVKDFGALGDGIADDTEAFQAAASAAAEGAIDNRQNVQAENVAMSPECSVYIPHGIYKITSGIDCGGATIRWVTPAETKIVGIDYLEGIIEFGSVKVSQMRPYGSGDQLNAFTAQVGGSHTKVAPLSGFDDYSDIVPYSQCDIVPVIGISRDDTTLVAKIESATFSGDSITGLTSLTDAQWNALRKGMRCFATDGTNRYIATITDWNESLKTISCDGGWYAYGGSSTAVTVPSGVDVYVNGKLSFFGGQFFVDLDNAGETAARVKVQENIYRNADSSVQCYQNGDYAGGFYAHVYDARAYGTGTSSRATAGFIARGNMWHGFTAGLSQLVGFAVRNFSESDSGVLKQYGFIDQTQTGAAFTAIGTSGRQCFTVSAENGHVELGDIGVQQPAYIDFHCSGDDSVDYDAKLYAQHSTDKTYVVVRMDGGLVVDGPGLRPYEDSGAILGSATYQWAHVYSADGVISSSDGRKKASTRDVDDALMRAWGRVGFKVFQFRKSIEEKGAEGARLHVGVIAQEVEAAFAAEGLDAHRYGLFCYDSWDDQYEEHDVVDEPAYTDGEGVEHPAVTHRERTLVRAAGDAYSIRYDEALALECAYQRWRLAQIEERLAGGRG